MKKRLPIKEASLPKASSLEDAFLKIGKALGFSPDEMEAIEYSSGKNEEEADELASRYIFARDYVVLIMAHKGVFDSELSTIPVTFSVYFPEDIDFVCYERLPFQQALAKTPKIA